MHLQCFTPMRMYKRDDHYPICTKLHYGCLLALCGRTMYVVTMWSFPDNFFFCLVCQPRLLEKKKKKIVVHHKCSLEDCVAFTLVLC